MLKLKIEIDPTGETVDELVIKARKAFTEAIETLLTGDNLNQGKVFDGDWTLELED